MTFLLLLFCMEITALLASFPYALNYRALSALSSRMALLSPLFCSCAPATAAQGPDIPLDVRDSRRAPDEDDPFKKRAEGQNAIAARI
jgi:hypothetical protein